MCQSGVDSGNIAHAYRLDADRIDNNIRCTHHKSYVDIHCGMAGIWGNSVLLLQMEILTDLTKEVSGAHKGAFLFDINSVDDIIIIY